MSDDIPEWAWLRAADLANTSEIHSYSAADVRCVYLGKVFARYIAQHETAPVDPLLIEAREAAAREAEYRGWEADDVAEIRDGRRDDIAMVQSALMALRIRDGVA